MQDGKEADDWIEDGVLIRHEGDKTYLEPYPDLLDRSMLARAVVREIFASQTRGRRLKRLCRRTEEPHDDVPGLVLEWEDAPSGEGSGL